MRFAIVDDDPLVRSGLAVVLGSEPGWEVVAEAGDGRSAVEAVEAHRPDVVLMDIRMPGMDGLAATREILAARPETVVLVLTTFELDEYLLEAVRAGAAGFLLKRVPPRELLDAVRLAADGESLLFPARLADLVRARGAGPRVPLPELTAREADTLRLLARGLSNAEIAREWVVSTETVKSHVASVLTKLGVRDRAQAAIVAYESGFVVPGL